jgi:hypothetical protein
LSNGFYNWTCQGCDNESLCTNATTRNFTIDYTYFIADSYTSSILEGVNSNFTANFQTNGSGITIAYLIYNGSAEYGSIAEHNSTNFTVYKYRTSPTITVDTNLSFYWILTYGGLGNRTFSAKNQTVLNFGIDNCTTNTVVLYNFTIVDEEGKTWINTTNNTLVNLNLQIYGYGTSTLIQEYNHQYSEINPFGVCINDTFTSEQYTIDVQIGYQADEYAKEFYHIQDETVTSTDFPTNITLYDINASDSQPFTLIYKDSSYLPVEDAIIIIGRKYIDEGVFYNVEIPKTDENGETVSHLVLNDIIYNFTIVKNGVTLDTFNNMLAVCQTPLVSECTIEFNSFAGAVGVPDFDEESDFEYTLGYINTTRIVQSNFTIPSGTPATILLYVNKTDALGSAICTDTITSTSGTLECSIPASIGNSTVSASLYKNGIFKGWGNIKIKQSPLDIYGTEIMVFVSITALVTLIGMALSGSPIITIILLMVGVIILFALNLVANNGFIGATATVLWVLIAFVLILIKGVKR